jgi:hypothetical protein
MFFGPFRPDGFRKFALGYVLSELAGDVDSERLFPVAVFQHLREL